MELKSYRSRAWDGRERLLHEQLCPVCNRTYLVPTHVLRNPKAGKYCSRKCGGLATRTRVEVACHWCGLVFERHQSKVGQGKSGLNFCSRSCKEEAQSLKGGLQEIQPAHYGTASEDYRKIAFEAKERVCERCGYCKYPEVLQVHHKNHVREDNRIENLEVLCPTCHLAHHFETKSGPWG